MSSSIDRNGVLQEEIALLIQGGIFARGNSVSFELSPDVGGDAPEA